MFDLEQHLLHTGAMHKDLPHDVQLMLLGLCIIGGLLIIALIRVWVLAGSNRRMRGELVKMEKQSLEQQVEITAIHHDAMSWRAKIQRQFDAFRSDLSHRLLQAEQSRQHAQKQLESVQEAGLINALAKIKELEAKLAATPVPVASVPDIDAAQKPAGMTKVPTPSLPALPAMETLRVQALENELSAARAEIAAAKRQNATLQQALLMARRRHQPAMRKITARTPVRPL
jgi:hypothetical protein